MRLGASLIALILTGCVGTPDAGCTTYGFNRASMPSLGTGPVDEWAAVTDSAMTAACR